jgi:hypothetical protein
MGLCHCKHGHIMARGKYHMAWGITLNHRQHRRSTIGIKVSGWFV